MLCVVCGGENSTTGYHLAGFIEDITYAALVKMYVVVGVQWLKAH